VRNLEIGAQFRDSENAQPNLEIAQRNLEIAQIPRLCGTYLSYDISGKKSITSQQTIAITPPHVIFAVNRPYKFGGCYQFVERADM